MTSPSIDLTEAEIEAAMPVADQLCEVVTLAAIGSDEDTGAVLFGVWVGLAHALARLGWTPCELAENAHRHAEGEQAP